MKHHLAAYLDNAISLLLFAVIGLTPLLFLNQTTEFFETPKLIFLAVATIVLLGLWIFSWILKSKVVITRTPLDIPLLLLLGVVLLSTFFSDSRFTAIYGSLPRVHDSAIAWVTYILLYFVAVSHLKSVAKIKSALYVLYTSAIVVTLLTLLSFFKLYLPFDFAQSVNFTPTGSSFSTIAFLLLLLPLPIISLVRPNKYLSIPVALILSILFSVTIVLIGSIPSFVALLIAYVLCIVVAKPHRVNQSLGIFLTPIIVSLVVLFFAYSPTPLPQGLNVLQKMEVNFPKEVQLPFAISWKISASAFRDAPFLGTGPSSYLFNFGSYKPLEFNALNVWSFSFDTATNEFLQVLGTLGIFGLIAVVIWSLIVINTSWKSLSQHSVEESEEGSELLLPALAVSGLLTVVLFAIHATTLVSVVITFIMVAILMASQRSIRARVLELSLGLKASTSDNKQFDLLPVIIFVVFLIGAVPALYNAYKAVAADYYHRMALSQATKSGTLTYQYLQKAESLNPRVDLYRVDMAQTNFALANAIAAKQKPGENTLTDQEKQTIQTLLSQSINEGRAAVALNQKSSRNWQVLAAIYRNIAGVAQNALAFSLDAYGRAIQRDPLNPALRVNVGGIYYAAKNYDQAIRFFTDAANLKPDYANAYFNLSIALRDKGDLQNAVLVAQQTVTLLQKDTTNPNYKVAVDLLNALKKQAEAGAQANKQGAPAAETNSALGNNKVDGVDVTGLKNAPTPTVTVAPVKANPNAKVPQPTATPTKAANQ